MMKLAFCFFAVCFMHCTGVYSVGPNDAAQKVERLHSVTGLDPVNILHSLEKFEEALVLVDQFLSHDLTDYERGWALLKKGTILTRLKRPQEALVIYEEIEEFYVSSDQTGVLLSSIFYERSKALSKIGQQECAIEVLQEAIEMARQAHYVSYDKEFRVEQMSIRMGRYLLLAERPDEALNAFKTTIDHLETHLKRKNSRRMERKIYSELSVAHKEMLEVYVHLGDISSAIDTCKTALEYAEKVNPSFAQHPWNLQIEERLAKLQENNS